MSPLPRSMVQLQPSSKPEIIYPDRDGQPMSDNTKQFRWEMGIDPDRI
jgi:hypothetical protein